MEAHTEVGSVGITDRRRDLVLQWAMRQLYMGICQENCRLGQCSRDGAQQACLSHGELKS